MYFQTKMGNMWDGGTSATRSGSGADRPNDDVAVVARVAPAVKHGRAVTSDGQVHRMRIAMPSSQTARLYGLVRNQNARVWCTCLDQKHPERQKVDPQKLEDAGLLPSGVYDPRLLGDFDWLGIVDVRVPNAALDLFRQHLTDYEGRLS